MHGTVGLSVQESEVKHGCVGGKVVGWECGSRNLVKWGSVSAIEWKFVDFGFCLSGWAGWIGKRILGGQFLKNKKKSLEGWRC